MPRLVAVALIWAGAFALHFGLSALLFPLLYNAHKLLPALQATFPQFRDTFARSSQHAAHADALLQEIAQQDLAAVGVPPAIGALRALGTARQANVLRYWLRQTHQTTPGTAQLHALQHQLAACATRGHRIELKVGRGFVVRQGELLGFVEALTAPSL